MTRGKVVTRVLGLLYAVAALAALGPAITSWRHRRRGPVARPLVLLHLGIAQWSLVDALHVSTADAHLSYLLSLAIYPGVCMVMVGFLWQALVAAGHGERLNRRHAAALTVMPVLTVLAAATDPWHHLFYSSAVKVPGSALLHIEFGPLFWVHTAYSYLLCAAAYTLMLQAMRRAVAGQRRIFVLMLLSAAAPSVGNVATLVGVGGRGTLDLTPVLFLVTAVSWWVLDQRWGQGLAATPLSTRQVLAALGDATIVLDPWGRFVDVNPAARTLLSTLTGVEGSVLGMPWDEVVGPELAAVLGARTPVTVTSGTGRSFDIRVTEIRSGKDRLLGYVAVARDITELETLRTDLADQASRDALTHVHNRRHLARVLDAEVAHAGRPGARLAVVMVDIDHFKDVNDTYGHVVGDELLVFLANVMASSLRSRDVVARYGGEEFVVVMPGASALVAARRAEQWRALCAASSVPSASGPVSATISLGVAQAVPGDTPDSLLRRADDALYRAKSEGRDRVVVAPGPTPTSAGVPTPFPALRTAPRADAPPQGGVTRSPAPRPGG